MERPFASCHDTTGIAPPAASGSSSAAGAVVALGLTVVGAAGGLAMLDIPSAIGFIPAGVPGYQSVGWFGVVAPAGTPPGVVARLDRAIGAALRDPEIAAHISAVGAVPAPGTPDEFGATIRSEIVKWSKVIAVAGARVE